MLMLEFRGITFSTVLLMLVASSGLSSDRIERSFPVSKNPCLILTNYSGSINVKSWPNSEIKASCVRYSQNVEVDTESMGNKVRISTHVLDKLSTAEKAKVDYQILTPEESNIEVRTNLGSVIIEKIKGEVKIDVMDAPVWITDVAGYLNVRSLNSKLEISGAQGIIQTMTVSGDIVLRRLNSGSVTANSTLGNIVYEGDFLNRGRYSFQTNEGVISIYCPVQASVEWEARTVKGIIETNLPIRSKEHSPALRTSFGKQSLLGTSNTGEATVQLSTFSGRIRIFRR